MFDKSWLKKNLAIVGVFMFLLTVVGTVLSAIVASIFKIEGVKWNEGTYLPLWVVLFVPGTVISLLFILTALKETLTLGVDLVKAFRGGNVEINNTPTADMGVQPGMPPVNPPTFVPAPKPRKKPAKKPAKKVKRTRK